MRTDVSSSLPAARRVLLADDDELHSRLLQRTLEGWGLVVEAYSDGASAWGALEAEDAPHLAIVDWSMPGCTGLELVQRVRALERKQPTYMLMLTGRGERQDMLSGLKAGADDYLLKPAEPEELRARIMNGVRVVELQLRLAQRVAELETALANVKQLQGLLPICAYCKNVRNDENYWQKVEAYFADHSDLRFSHAICPSCFETIIEPQLRDLENRRSR